MHLELPVLLSISEPMGKRFVILAEQNDKNVHLGRDRKFVSQFSLNVHRVGKRQSGQRRELYVLNNRITAGR